MGNNAYNSLKWDNKYGQGPRILNPVYLLGTFVKP